MKNNILLLLTLAAVQFNTTVVTSNSHNSSSSEFYRQLANTYLDEYRMCTTDSQTVSLKQIIEWKAKINAFRESAVYDSLFKKYCNISLINPLQIKPCDVYQWYQNEIQDKKDIEKIIDIGKLEKEKLELENKFIESELERTKISIFDFPTIPFGVSKAAFSLIFERFYNFKIIDAGQYLFARDFPWGAEKFLTAFYFNENGEFFKYEIESPSYNGDELNNIVRPIAMYMHKIFERKLGKATQQFRVGYYDIKPGTLATLAYWESQSYYAAVGLCCANHRYYAKAIVTDKEKSKKHPLKKP